MSKMPSYYSGCKLIILSALFVLGFFYYYMTSLKITILEFRDNKTFFSADTRLLQRGTLYFLPYAGRVKAVYCAEEKIAFDEEPKWHETRGELVEIHFYKPTTLCAVEPDTIQERRALVVQKITLFDFLVLFLFWGAPVIYFLFPWMMLPLEILKTKISKKEK